MKTLAFAFLAVISLSVGAETAPLSGGLAWDYVQADEALIDGFRLYADGAVVYEIADPAAREVSFADAGIAAGSYTFSMSAYNAVDESEQSNSLSATIVDGAPPAPTLLRIQVTLQ